MRRGRLTAPTRLLHWTVALGILAMLAFGFWLARLPGGPDKGAIVQLHKSLGMLLLVPVLARIAWRWREGFPEHPARRPWERRAARTAHGLLLAATLLMPLSGIARSLAYARPVSVFGLPVIPQLFAAKQEGLYALAAGLHDWLAPILVGLIALHAAAALKHHWIDRDDTLRNMVGIGR